MVHRPEEIEVSLIARTDGRNVLEKASRLETLDGFVLRAGETLRLVDRYFDTSDRALGSRLIALRVRESNADVFLTVKGAGQAVATGGTRRLEIEKPWSAQTLDDALATLAAIGVPLETLSSPTGVEADATSTLETLGFRVVQERETERRVRLLSAEHGSGILAEVDLDAVVYRLSVGAARLYELEIEAKDHALELGHLVTCLLREIPELSPWPHAKFATGIAMERALSAGSEILDEDGAVSFDGLASLELELARL